MVNDTELKRLKSEQDRAFQQKQDTYRAQKSAWENRRSIRDRLDESYQAKQAAMQACNESWLHYQSVRVSNFARIRQIDGEQRIAFQHMDLSSEHRDDYDRLTAERGELSEGVRTAKSEHEARKAEFEQVKKDFFVIKNAHDSAREKHENLKAMHEKAEEDFDSASRNYRAYARNIHGIDWKRKEEQDLMKKVGVPSQHIDTARVVQKTDGHINIYFGGVDAADGPGHGHYVVGPDGSVTYRRDPFEMRGKQNFISELPRYEDVIAEEALFENFGFRCLFLGQEAFVQSSIEGDGTPRINIYYGPKGPFGDGHLHVVVSRESPLDFTSTVLQETK